MLAQVYKSLQDRLTADVGRRLAALDNLTCRQRTRLLDSLLQAISAELEAADEAEQTEFTNSPNLTLVGPSGERQHHFYP